MKNPIFIIPIILFVLSFKGYSHAQTPQTAESPLDNLKKSFQDPSDPLTRTLQQVREIEKESWAAQKIEETAVKQNDVEEFINPFIPQTPKPPKPTPAPAPDLPKNVEIPQQKIIPTPQFKVSGLVWNSKKPTAILNGEVVGIGDQVNNWTISNITKEGVYVTFEDEELWIKPVVNPDRGSQRNY